MTRTGRIAGLVLALLLAMTVIPAAAEETAESVVDDPSQLAGIQAGVTRSWNTTMDMSTPPADGASFVYFAGATVLEFDSEDNAEAAFGALREYFETNATEEIGIPAEDITFEERDDPGDAAFVFEGGFADETSAGYFRFILVHDDEYVYYAGAVTSDEDAASIADDLAAYIDEQDDDASGLGEYNEDGTSTGGLWDLLPAADDDMFEGLAVSGDQIQYPVEEDAAA
jgi:hypothetical protein